MISLGLTQTNALPIGLDIGHGLMHMVQVARNGGISVIAADKMRIDQDCSPQQRRQVIVSGIKQMLSRSRFEGRCVVTALANEKLNVTSLRLGQMSDEQTEKAVMEEARQRFTLASDEDVVRYLPVGQVKQGDDTKNEFVLFAANGTGVRQHLEMLEEAGLVPVGLDAIPCALFRSFDHSMRREEDRQQTLVFVDVGKCFTTVVFGKGGEIAFVKEIPVGTQKYDSEISDKLGITVDEACMLRGSLRSRQASEQPQDDSVAEENDRQMQDELDVSTRQAIVDTVDQVAQELAREISLCFRYYTVTFRGSRVERAIFAGGGACENILLNVMRRQLTMDVEVADPFRGFDMTRFNFENGKSGNLSDWAVAVGLALKGASQ